MILAIDNKHEADTEISAAALRALLNLRSKINGVHILYHDRVQTPSGALLFNPTHMQEVISGGLSDKKRITTDEYIERYFKPFHDGK